MRLLLPLNIQEQLRKFLSHAGDNETGGILMGQHIAKNEFRVLEITRQRGGGSFAFFVRSIKGFIAPLKQFFTRTKHNYTEFNYIGEWHSHPSFELLPSLADCESMQSLVEDPSVGATFVVLLLVRIGKAGKLEASSVVFLPRHSPFSIEAVLEQDGSSLHDETV